MAKYIKKGLNWYAGLWPKKFVKPPYKHVVQIGDPVLRRKSEIVPVAFITSNETKKIILSLMAVLKHYNCLGISAPQIGVNKRIFLMELTQSQLNDYDQIQIENREMTVVPFTIFINPIMKVLDQKKVSHEEGCESVKGYTAHVPRFKEVLVEGYDEKGQQVSVKYHGWSARMAQHEMDHLDGKVYTDIMKQDTFSCICWKEINIHQGKLELPFAPL